MDFTFSEEQTLLRNSVQRFLQDRYDFETRRKILASEEGWRPDYWKQFAELGLLAAPFAEGYGGLGGSAIETMIVMEEFGKGLVVEPYLPTVVLAGGLLRHGGTNAQKEELIPQIIGGDLVAAFAYAEPQGRYNLADLTTTAKKKGAAFVLNGHKSVVFGAPWADKLLVSARTAGGQREEKGVTVFLVDKDAKGVSTRDYPTVDGFRASEVTFDNVEVPAEAIVGGADQGLALVERVADEAIGALCAEAIGAMKMITDATVDYSRTRKQFGVPIGSFQVLQHAMVDMYLNYEQSVSITYMINMKLDAPEAERKKAASAAKAHIGKAGRFIGQNAVQIHGGMGVTEELSVGHYFKRLTMINIMFGDVDHHMRRYRMLAG
jgi:pimeloyl-CoA dehydrogenase small subunit